jgi:hypothetical protein
MYSGECTRDSSALVAKRGSRIVRGVVLSPMCASSKFLALMNRRPCVGCDGLKIQLAY